MELLLKTHTVHNSTFTMAVDPVDPDRIGPDMGPQKSFMQSAKEKPRRVLKSISTREGIIGDYDYAFLFKPNLPFMKKERRAAPFFGLNDKMPLLLAIILGFQHALAMLAGVITPPIILAGAAGGNFPLGTQQYLVPPRLSSAAFSPPSRSHGFTSTARVTTSALA